MVFHFVLASGLKKYSYLTFACEAFRDKFFKGPGSLVLQQDLCDDGDGLDTVDNDTVDDSDRNDATQW